MKYTILTSLIVLIILSLGIIFCVWRRSKAEDRKMGIFQIIRVKKNDKGKEEAYVEETKGAAADS